jgi:peptidoglycan/LPS O-acetylase OafA/YrhL
MVGNLDVAAGVGLPRRVGASPGRGADHLGKVNVSGASIPGAADVTLCLISNAAKVADLAKMVARAISWFTIPSGFQFRTEFCETPRAVPDPSRSPKSRAQGRAGAASLILVLFAIAKTRLRGAWWFDLLVGHGYLWVEFFFALSGFILTYVYGARALEFLRGRTHRDFLVARLSRLYPLHFAMLLYILAMMLILNAIAHATGTVSIYQEQYHPVVTWQTFVANLFLVQAWNIFPYLSWNGASWFVSVEFLLCILFPIYMVLSRGGWWGALGLIVAGSGGLAILSITGKHGLDITFHNGIFRGMSAFAIGVGLCVLYRQTKQWGDSLPEWALSLAQAAVLVAMGFGTFDNGWSHTPRDIYTVLPMLALIYVLAFDRGFLAKALNFLVGARRMVVCDLHRPTPVLQLLQRADASLSPRQPTSSSAGHGRVAPLWHWFEPALLVLACVIWVDLYIAVERPANAWLKRLNTHNASARVGLTL